MSEFNLERVRRSLFAHREELVGPKQENQELEFCFSCDPTVISLRSFKNVH